MRSDVLSLVSSFCKICDNDVVGINLRCSGQVRKCPIWTSVNSGDFAKKNSFLPLIWCLHSLFCWMYRSFENEQSNKANIKHIEDVYMLVYYQFNTCSAFYHHLLSQSHVQLYINKKKFFCCCFVYPTTWTAMFTGFISISGQWMLLLQGVYVSWLKVVPT